MTQAAPSKQPCSGAGLAPLEPEHGCCDGLNWRSATRGEMAAEQFENRMAQAGFDSRCRHGWLVLMRDEHGHEVAWVPATGRMQFRVHLTVERELRESVARELHVRVAAAIDSVSPDSVESGSESLASAVI